MKFIKAARLYLIILFLSLSWNACLYAQQPAQEPVELNGDVIEYSVDGNKIVAQGNVVIIHPRASLYADEVEFFRDSKQAYAKGHVRLVMETGEISGEKMDFNFNAMTGDFHNAKIHAHPYYGQAKKISKVGENEILMKDGFFTTSDYDKPGYRLYSPKIEIYPQDKLVARNVRMIFGETPLMYFPKYTQDLSGKKPFVVFTPGFNKDWGMFMLSRWIYRLNDYIDGQVHLDAREKKDIAWGVDMNYKTKGYGSGFLKTYYMNERNLGVKRFYLERTEPTIERERFRVQWRHNWDIDDRTQAVMQYYKLSDKDFLKDYFEKEYDSDSNPDTFFLLTKALDYGTLSLRVEPRINRFEDKVERLPELRYDLSSLEIADTGLYLKNTTMYSNLTSKTASPSEVRQNTMRLYTDSEISYPFKIAFIDINPFIGTQQTYYSKTKDPSKYDSIRGLFKTGASLSTKIFKAFDVHKTMFGENIARMRHVVTPSVDYKFQTDPTLNPSALDTFDSFDSIDNAHTVTLSLDNKLQVKNEKGETWDWLRAVISTDFNLKEHPGKGSFNEIKTDIDFKPVQWLTLYFDSVYDAQQEYLSTANFDFYINGGDKYYIGVSKRWNRDVDDQVTTDIFYRFNPKWAAHFYHRFDVMSGTLKEQNYVLTRDLHSWTMDVSFNETRDEGNEILLIFTLKAFPDITIDAGTGFNKRKAGSQSEGDN